MVGGVDPLEVLADIANVRLKFSCWFADGAKCVEFVERHCGDGQLKNKEKYQYPFEETI